MLSRRQLLSGSAASALAFGLPIGPVKALLHGSAPSGFNGGKSQINLQFLGFGDFAFMNLMKSSTPQLQGSGTLAVTPDIVDSNGWLTSFPSGAANVLYAVLIPTGNEVPGIQFDLKWTGSGVATLIVVGGDTIVSGSLTPSGGIGHVVFSCTDPTLSTISLSFNAPVQNIQLCDTADVTALNSNGNEFGRQFVSVLKSLKPGVIRFLNWTNGNQTNATTWASRTPLTYSSFQTTLLDPNNYGGATTKNGSDYSCGLPPGGFTLADKARLQVWLNAAPPVDGTATFTNASVNVAFPSHGLVAGNQIYLIGSITNFTGSTFRSATAPTTYFVKTVVDANTITLAATAGGSAISAGSSGTASIFPLLTLSVNGGAKTPVWGQFSIPYPQSFTSYPSGGDSNSLMQLVYDSTFGAFVNFKGGNPGVPPEVCLQLCQKVGAHPWLVAPFLALDPATDYNTQLATYIQTTYQNGSASWMVPIFETPNECWNTAGTYDTTYATQKAIMYGWGNNNWNDWIGKVASIGGQQLANVFGVGNLGTKYHWVVGVATGVGLPSDSNSRLASTSFLSSDPNTVQSPYTRTAAAGGAQNWVSAVAPANYFSPLERDTCQEVIDGYAWTVTDAGSPTAQAALANSYVDTLVSRSATVTVNSGSANITWTAHGRTVGDQVVFTAGTVPTGFTKGVGCFIKSVVDANTITLSATSGGTTITPTASGTPTLSFAGGFNLADLYRLFTAWKTWAVGFSVSGLFCYEGGYSPDYVGTFDNVTTGITGATQAASCVLTLASTSSDPHATMTGNPAVVGMSLTVSGVSGMTQLNGNTYTVTAVSGNQVTINVNSSGFGAYTSGGSVTWVSSPTYINNLRGAGKLASNLQGYLTTNYNNFNAAGGTFPSCFQLTNSAPPPGTDVWSILDDIYQPFSTSPQALAIQAFNS